MSLVLKRDCVCVRWTFSQIRLRCIFLSMDKLLQGKIALVTGSSRGLGKSIVSLLKESGASGLGVDQTENSEKFPEDWLFHRGDVSDEECLSEAIARIDRQYDRLDIVVANAGVVPPWNHPEDLDIAEWDRVFGVNVRGVAITMKHAVPLMKKSGGSIILMGSLASHRGYAGQMLYTATKHAVLGIVRASALDLGPHNIRVNAIGPGPIATDALMTRITSRSEHGGSSPSKALADLESETALGRIATENEVAKTALFLASELSSGITGQIVPVDAGIL